jgi:outer membrane protein assembly factor BamB
MQPTNYSYPNLKSIVLISLISTMFFCSCEQKDFLIELPADEQIQALPFRYEDKLVIAASCDGEPCMQAISIHTGKEKWRIHPCPAALWSHGLGGTPYIHKQHWIAVADSTTYIIDLRNGKVIDTKSFDGELDSHIAGHADYIYPIVQYRDSISRSVIYRWNIETGETKVWQEYNFPYPASINIKGPVQLAGNKLMHSLLLYRPRVSTHNYFCYLDAAGTLIDSIAMDSVNFKGVGVTRPPIIDNAGGKYFWHTVDGITATDIESGEILWSEKYGLAMMAARPLLWEGYLLYPSDSRTFLLIDKETGGIHHELEEMPSVPSRLYASGGGLYFTDISGLFNRLSISTSPFTYEIEQRIHKDKKPVYPSFYADEDIMALHIGNHWLIGTPEKFMEDFEGL